jgi:ParB family transcriptional regulator, chromosome partitioning protein
MEHQLIEINKLEKSPQNSRRTVARGAAEDLKASILAHGILHNLVVTAGEGGTYRVTDGGRRLEALQALQAEGKLPADYAVPCQVRGEEDALETSLAANTVRLAMHPADEFEAFARLAEDGHTPEQIAERFGKTARHVEQRLRLGNADPKLLKEYRAENLTLDCLTAFAITDDRKRQMKVYRSLKDGHALNPRAIRTALTEEMAEAGSNLAKFVGLDAYREAGGTTQSDLFSEAVYLENPALLNDLAVARLDAARQQLEAEGWGWVTASLERDQEVIHSCERIYPQPGEVPQELAEQRQQIEAELDAIAEEYDDGNGETDGLYERQEPAEAKLAEIEARIEALAVYDPDHVAIAGCYVSIAHDGSLSIDRGLVRKADRKLLAKGCDAPAQKPKGMPETLRRDLETYRLQTAQAALAGHPVIALDLLVFSVARYLAHRPVYDGPDVHFTRHYGTPGIQKEQTAAADALKAIEAGLPMAWADKKTEAGQFQAFRELPVADKLRLLAYCVATTLRPQLGNAKADSAYEQALSLTDASVAAYWRPNAVNYLGRITREQLLALGREVLGEQWAQSRSKAKKGELAAQLERVFADPGKHARNPQQLDKLTQWLPEGMAFTAIAAEQPKAKKTARKAA